MSVYIFTLTILLLYAVIEHYEYTGAVSADKTCSCLTCLCKIFTIERMKL